MRTWKPDTCDCLVEEIYEGTTIKGCGAVLRKCPAHASVPDEELYGVLYANPDGENKRKNHLLRVLLGHEGVKGLGLEQTKRGVDGSDHVTLKDDVQYEWSFSGNGRNRVLNVKVHGATVSASKKNEIAAHCGDKFGAGRVVLL